MDKPSHRAPAPLALHRSKCLRARLRVSACRACVDACPAAAVRIDAGGVVVGAGCTGCGRCQAACPTGAIAAEGFAGITRAADAQGARRVLLECARFEPASPQALRVPCLGGISPAALLELCAADLARQVVLVDRGACGACDSGVAPHPAAATLARVCHWMEQAGVPPLLLPRLEFVALSGRSRCAADPLQSLGRSRRGFLGALVPAASEAAAPEEPDTPAPRQRILAALRTLAGRHGGRVAPDLFQRLEVSDRCRGVRVCAVACPTGALRRYRGDAGAFVGIAFDPAECIACGHCTAVCPQRALRLRPGAAATEGLRPLTRFAQRACADCGAPFTQHEGETRCERCRKSVQLAHAAFGTLFPASTRLQCMESTSEEPR